ncbi:hypothetical protein BKG76_00365 [Mycobacteroides franklinii]|uniref:Uncharacterized protein n=1 Tax=Mycobacteroides franklinii TaxID=948102 RepID=A0A1S1LJW5_9MYCO|nr:hypothetical protein [Mycobacteroides franklinii]OHU31702.1 hypothetical protein BKG76_00365 [Mycobacteroides franklinii]
MRIAGELVSCDFKVLGLAFLPRRIEVFQGYQDFWAAINGEGAVAGIGVRDIPHDRVRRG